jgi:pilus assembly protein CpaB
MVNKKFLLLALILAAFTTLTVFLYMKNVEKNNARMEEKRPVVVAKINIPTKTILTSEMLAIKRIPLQYLPPEGTIKNIEEAIGKVLVINAMPGQMIFSQDIKDKGANLGLSFIVPEGKRAISVQVDPAAGIGGLVKPGDMVDVLVTFGEEQKSVTVLQNAQVLAINQQTEMKADTKSGERSSSATIVTLALSPKDAERLVLAGSQGLLQLALRSIQDTQNISTSGTSLGSIVNAAAPNRSAGEGKRVSAPAPVHYARGTVRVIRGTTEKTEEIR